MDVKCRSVLADRHAKTIPLSV